LNLQVFIMLNVVSRDQFGKAMLEKAPAGLLGPIGCGPCSLTVPASGPVKSPLQGLLYQKHRKFGKRTWKGRVASAIELLAQESKQNQELRSGLQIVQICRPAYGDWLRNDSVNLKRGLFRDTIMMMIACPSEQGALLCSVHLLFRENRR
jgi:hypothetical protein